MSNNSHAHTPHVLPLKVYLGVGAALLFLTVVTVIVAQVPLGGWNLVVALMVASIKALLVASFFMHLYYDHKLYYIIFSIGVLVLSVFIVLTMFDTLERGALDNIKARPINPKAMIYDTTAVKHDSVGQTKPSGH